MIRKSIRHSAKTPSARSATTPTRIMGELKLTSPAQDGVQGEGDYAAARRFNEAERKFVASGKVAAAARAAPPTTEAERQAMVAAEEEGKRRAKK